MLLKVSVVCVHMYYSNLSVRSQERDYMAGKTPLICSEQSKLKVFSLVHTSAPVVLFDSASARRGNSSDCFVGVKSYVRVVYYTPPGNILFKLASFPLVRATFVFDSGKFRFCPRGKIVICEENMP